MRPEHAPSGDPCEKCGLASARHRHRTRARSAYFQHYNLQRPYREREYVPAASRIIGIDGEGIGRKPHLYRYLAAVDENGTEWDISSDKGLSAQACLDFILSLPQPSLILGYGFLYDLTKQLEQLDDEALYALFRPKLRAFMRNKRMLFHPVEWRKYQLNYMNRQFSVRRFSRRATVWDVVAFYQSTFTKAIELWKVGTTEELAEIQAMKERRGAFTEDALDEIKRYCRNECRLLAGLGRKLIEAHERVGLKLTRYHGAGSTAGALLKAIKLRDKLGIFPKAMRKPLACAFFGGRFENRVIGPVEGPLYSYDIASAYPYAAYFLPCLLHGEWTYVENPTYAEIETANLALVHWRIAPQEQLPAWGTLPVRSKEGTIVFPASGKGGWTWKAEFLAASRFVPVGIDGSWIYRTSCDCLSPFVDIPRLYVERMRLGKDGPGIVLKLGLNSIYGKLAQSAGYKPPYQSWIYAGNITSETRAALLTAIYLAPDPSDVLMCATDGIQSRVKLNLPAPRLTGTESTGKALGSWQEKVIPSGTFFARPGVYFPLNPTPADIDELKGRGIGKKTLISCNVYECEDKLKCSHPKNYQRIAQAYAEGRNEIDLVLSRFVGAKTGITYGPKSGYKRRPDFGDWIPFPVKLTFDPRPKRYAAHGKELICMPHLAFESMPYDNALKSHEAIELLLSKDIADEQPEGC